MPLSPAPLLPGTSPIPTPGRRPPDRRALRLGALTALPVLVLALVVGKFALPYALFLAPGLQAQAGGGDSGSGVGDFQGFQFVWTRHHTGGGYTSSASLDNLRSEQHDFHMNSVVIPVVADMPARSKSDIYWHSTDQQNVDTLPDGDYVKAIQDARQAGLVPILELELRQQDPVSPNQDPTYIGETWSSLHSGSSIGLGVIGTLERTWFNNYTAFAVHYAQMSAQYNLPYFIIGDQFTNLSYDTAETSKKGDPQGIDIPPGDSYQCSGRRECEWRHVIQAIRSPGYATLKDHKSQVGGKYTGKLIYAARWTSAPEGGATDPEFEHITWWDAVDYIGVDAYFALTQNQADVDVNVLQQAWQGVGQGLGPEKDIYSRLEKVSDTYHHPILFTAAGYNSSPGSNSASPGQAAFDDVEQLNDMQALLLTFRGTSWWAGVFWYADAPAAPRESQPNWQYSPLWAGNTLASSKKSGQWLATYYQPSPLLSALPSS
jgi:hypothetical protein